MHLTPRTSVDWQTQTTSRTRTKTMPRGREPGRRMSLKQDETRGRRGFRRTFGGRNALFQAPIVRSSPRAPSLSLAHLSHLALLLTSLPLPRQRFLSVPFSFAPAPLLCSTTHAENRHPPSASPLPRLTCTCSPSPPLHHASFMA